MPPTRQVFQGLSRGEIVAWYGMIVVSTAIFAWGAAQLVAKYRRARPERLGRPPLPRRVGDMLRVTVSHQRIKRRDHLAGMAHLLVFSGFLLLLAGTTILGIQTDLADIARIREVAFENGQFVFALGDELWVKAECDTNTGGLRR